MKPIHLLASFYFLVFIQCANAQEIVPRPLSITPTSDQFLLNANTHLVATGEARIEAEKLRDYLRPATGYEFPITKRVSKGDIQLIIDPKAEQLGNEGYLLDVTSNDVKIKALKATGLFYGVQSLRQLLPAEIYRSAKIADVKWVIAGTHIEDNPRFSWRGSHMDVSRRFMSKEFVLKHLELMAQHKLNIFHWHLTDDQGWRIEIKKYPKLTTIGAWRKQTTTSPYVRGEGARTFDGKPAGGFYTQDDIREVVAFAAARHITVVPEIEMPGHAQAAIAAYPEFGNFPDAKTEVAEYWGVFPVVFSVEDRTIAFLKDILDEVLVLFPSPFIHVGGDECPKAEWSKAPSALARMKQLKLVSENTTLEDLQHYSPPSDSTRNGTLEVNNGKPVEHPALHKLQSWFISQMDAYLTSKGRRLLGWDEILEGGLAPGATVMSWRGEQGGIDAAVQNHDVVMAPRSWTYLDFFQIDETTPGFREPVARKGVVSLDHVYAYEPVPAEMPAEKAKHVLGSQAQLWSEHMVNEKQTEYQAWPRLSAMSEVLWSAKERRDFADFQTRLPADLKRLDAQDVNYRQSNGPRWPY